MDDSHFDALAETIAGLRTRRQVARALIAGVVGIFIAPVQGDARRRRCRTVGARCKKHEDCCSEVCKGKPKNMRCRAHDSAGCKAGNEKCRTPPESCVTTAGEQGGCLTTTGRGGYCAATGECADCFRDSDCHAQFGKRAACVICDNCDVGTACARTKR